MLFTKAAKDRLEWPGIRVVQKEDFDLMVIFDVFAVENVGNPSNDFFDEGFDSILWKPDADLVLGGRVAVRTELREDRLRWY